MDNMTITIKDTMDNMTMLDRIVKGFVMKNEIMDNSYAQHAFTGWDGLKFQEEGIFVHGLLTNLAKQTVFNRDGSLWVERIGEMKDSHLNGYGL